MGLAQTPRGILQLGARRFAFDIRGERVDFLPQPAQRLGQRVRHHFRLAHAAFLGKIAELRDIADLMEKPVGGGDRLLHGRHGGGLAEGLEQALAGLRVIEPLEVETQAGLGNPQAELHRRHLLDGVRLVEHREIVGKQKTAGFFRVFLARPAPARY